jgi:hypothetical protein
MDDDCRKLVFHDLPPDHRLKTIEISAAQCSEWRLRSPKIRARPWQSPTGQWIYPESILRAGDVWLAVTRTSIDPQLVTLNPRDLYGWFEELDEKEERGEPLHVLLRLTEERAVQWLLEDGQALPEGVVPPPLEPSSTTAPVEVRTVPVAKSDDPARPETEADIAECHLVDDLMRVFKRRPAQMKLVQYLWGKPDHLAPLDEIAVQVQGRPFTSKEYRRIARRLAERTRDSLLEEGSSWTLAIMASNVRLGLERRNDQDSRT